jgi:hypothetical protein
MTAVTSQLRRNYASVDIAASYLADNIKLLLKKDSKLVAQYSVTL